MVNVLKKTLCIEWSVRTPSTPDTQIESEAFLFQNRKCNLNFYTGYFVNGCGIYANLGFKSKFKLKQPAKIDIRIFENSNVLDRKTSTVTADVTCCAIWCYSKKEAFAGRQVAFECIFHDVEDLNEISADKSLQTPSYIDNCFLMEGIARDFSMMLDDSPCYDLEFVCGDQSIKAHKSILSCRSNVFASMLQSDMVEGNTARVIIQDMNETLLREFLKCLYTGVLPPLTLTNAQKLYAAGDKYNISSLKKQCADFLTDNLMPKNAYENLILSDRHNDPDMKKDVIAFMVQKQMPYSGKEWTEFSQECPALAVEVLNLYFQ